ncbi:unnamed protein product, partial [Ilex paraguariensis]
IATKANGKKKIKWENRRIALRRKGNRKTGILKKGQDLKGKEKEWQKVTRKGGPKVTVEEGHQVPNSLLYPNGLSEGVIAANKFNVLNGDHSGKDVGEEENAEMENHNGSPSRSFEGMKVYEVIDTPSQTQGTGPDEVQQTGSWERKLKKQIKEIDCDEQEDHRLDDELFGVIPKLVGLGDNEKLTMAATSLELKQAYGVRPQAMEGMTGMDLLRTLKVDMRHKLRPKIIWVDWSPPPSGCLKLNVDGVSKAAFSALPFAAAFHASVHLITAGLPAAGFSAAVQLVLMSLLCLLLLSMKVSVAAVGFGLLGTVYVLCLVAAADGASTDGLFLRHHMVQSLLTSSVQLVSVLVERCRGSGSSLMLHWFKANYDFSFAIKALSLCFLIYDDNALNAHAVCLEVCSALRLQAHGIKPKATEGIMGTEFLKALEVEVRYELKPKIVWVNWSPPIPGYLKLNVDGASKGNPEWGKSFNNVARCHKELLYASYKPESTIYNRYCKNPSTIGAIVRVRQMVQMLQDRNRKVYEDISLSAHAVFLDICSSLRLRAYGTRPEAKEGMMGMDLLRALKVEMRQELEPKNIWINWSPPPSGFLKLNVDGASKGNPGRAGAGAVLDFVLISAGDRGSFCCYSWFYQTLSLVNIEGFPRFCSEGFQLDFQLLSCRCCWPPLVSFSSAGFADFLMVSQRFFHLLDAGYWSAAVGFSVAASFGSQLGICSQRALSCCVGSGLMFIPHGFHHLAVAVSWVSSFPPAEFSGSSAGLSAGFCWPS